MRRFAVAACAALLFALPIAFAEAATKTVSKIGTGKTKAGVVVTGASGRTLYFFANDKKTKKSTCYNACAVVWPPVLATKKPAATGKAKASLIGLTTRKDGTKQVTYAGLPLYYFVKDQKAGQIAGNFLKDQFGFWGALLANGKVAKKT